MFRAQKASQRAASMGRSSRMSMKLYPRTTVFGSTTGGLYSTIAAAATTTTSNSTNLEEATTTATRKMHSMISSSVNASPLLRNSRYHYRKRHSSLGIVADYHNHKNNNNDINNSNSVEQHVRCLFYTLRAFSTVMPRKLVALNHNNNSETDKEGEILTRAKASWRHATVFEGFRIPPSSTTTTKSASAAAAVTWRSRNLASNMAVLEEPESDEDEADNVPGGKETSTLSNDNKALETPEQQEEMEEFSQFHRMETTKSSAAFDPVSERETAMEDLDDEGPSASAIHSFSSRFATDKDPRMANAEEAQQSLNPDLILQEMQAQFAAAVKQRRLTDAMNLFETATVLHGVDLPLDAVTDFFFLLSHSHPFHTYQVMQHILQRTSCNIFVRQPNSNDDSIRIQESPLSLDGNIHRDFNSGTADNNPNQSIDNNATDSAASVVAATPYDVPFVTVLYRQMCFSISKIDPIQNRYGEIRTLVGAVSSELKQLVPEVEKKCLPVLVHSLIVQKMAKLGLWAGRLYHRMQGLGIEMPPLYYENLLLQSRYNRNNDLPYHEVLQHVVRGGLRPLPHIVMNAVENMFPYTENVKATYVALDCVMELQRESMRMLMEQEEKASDIQRQMQECEQQQQQQHSDESSEMFQELKEELDSIKPPNFYIMDIASLEYMATAATRKQYVELILLIWDALDLMGFEPTEAIYENTVLCFAQNKDLWKNSFFVLKDMEDVGFTSSLGLVRGAALALRTNLSSLESADKMIRSCLDGSGDGIELSTAALNVLLAAHAWRGNVEQCMTLLEEMSRSQWSPDMDSYAFAMESIGKALRRMVDNPKLRMSPRTKQNILDEFVNATDTILTRMEATRDADGRPLEPNNIFTRNYVEFLCLLKQVDTATMVAKDLLEKGQNQEQQLVDNKALACVAIENAKMGDFDTARKFLASMSESLDFLDVKIDRMQTRKELGKPEPYSLD